MRLLGIDFGSSSIKAVELDSAFGRYEVHDYHEQMLPPEAAQNEAVFQEVVRTLINSLARKPDKVAVSLRTSLATFRNLEVPSKDRKTILSTIGFELEDELPFPDDESIFDIGILSQNAQGSSVHVAATLKQTLQTQIDRLVRAGIDPDTITTEPWAFRNLLNRGLSQDEQVEPTLVLHIGHTHTLAYGHWRGSPLLARELDFGGQDFDLAICQKYGLPLEEARASKQDRGFLLPLSQHADATAEQIEFSKTLEAPYLKLFREVRSLELALRSLSHQRPARLFLSGGTALLPGLGKRLEEGLQIPARNLLSLSSLSHAGVTYSEQSDSVFALAAGTSLALLSGQKAGQINLRKGEFARAGSDDGFSLSKLKRPLQAIGAIATSMLLSLGIQGHVFEKRVVETNIQLERSVKSFFGGISNSAVRNYLANSKNLKKQVTRELNKQRELAQLKAPNPESPLEFLKTLSTQITKDVNTDLISLQVGARTESAYQPEETKKVSLTFIFASPQVGERIATMVGNFIENPERSKMEEIPAPAGVGPKLLQFTLSGRPKGAAYGK